MSHQNLDVPSHDMMAMKVMVAVKVQRAKRSLIPPPASPKREAFRAETQPLSSTSQIRAAALPSPYGLLIELRLE